MSACAQPRLALERIPGYAGLPEAARRAVLETVDCRNVPAGASALRAGDDPHSCLLVCSGQLQGSEGDNVLIAGPGALLGLEHLLTDTAPLLQATAIEAAQVLLISRGALLASPECRLLGRQLVEALRLRLPIQPAPGCRVVMTADPSTSLLLHPGHGVYRLSPISLLLWQHLDGQRLFRDLVLVCSQSTGRFAPEPLLQALRGLAEAGFLAPLPLAHPVAAALFPRAWHQRVRRRMCWRRSSTVPISALERLYRGGGWRVCTRPALLLQAGCAAAGLLLASGTGAQGVQDGPRRMPPYLVAGALTLHELGHVLATLRTGYPLLGVGVGMQWLIPIIYVDTTAVWLGSPRDRLVVSLAGAWANVSVGGALLMLARLSPRHAPMFTVGARASYGCALFTLQPLFAIDGQQAIAALSDCLRAPARCTASTRGAAAVLQTAIVVLALRRWVSRRRAGD